MDSEQYYYGIDASTSRVGICVLDSNKRLIVCEDHKLNPKHKLERRVNQVEDRLKELFKEYPPVKVLVEEPVKTFRRGFSNANTIAMLQRVNGMFCYSIYVLTNGKHPNTLEVKSARRKAGLIVPKGTQDVKKLVIEYVMKIFPSFIAKKTPMGNYSVGTDDRADAIVLALCALKEKKDTRAPSVV